MIPAITPDDIDPGAMMDALLGKDFARKLERLANSRAEEYQTADPFPHIVIDDFLPIEALNEALRQFPSPEQLRWIKYDEATEVKLAFPDAERLPRSLRETLYFLNSPIILQFLERLTGIAMLISDPYFVGGGLHQIQKGGHLGVHADFNKHNRYDLDRRLNLLIYLNQDWKEEYGGHLELWDSEMSRCVKRVLPVFNRCVIFSTTSHSFHGHPVPLSCPDGWTRKSIATYYYTNGRPEEEQGEEHSTLFRHRPGLVIKPQPYPIRMAKKVARMLLPPIVTEAWYHLRAPKK
ncbi:MAG: 2OG-Fe(II) oxygenase [Blastocatellales bacterium]